LGKNIAKIVNLGSKKAGLSSDFWENCMILKKISIGKRASSESVLYQQENHYSYTRAHPGGKF
jgi:hypothetical protein